MKRAGLKGRLRDAKQNRLAARGTPTFGLCPLVCRIQFTLVDMLALQKGRFTGILDLPFLEHLANDDLDVLVVDLDALKPVDVLHLVDHVARKRLDARIDRMSWGAGLPSIM